MSKADWHDGAGTGHEGWARWPNEVADCSGEGELAGAGWTDVMRRGDLKECGRE